MRLFTVAQKRARLLAREDPLRSRCEHFDGINSLEHFLTALRSIYMDPRSYRTLFIETFARARAAIDALSVDTGQPK